MIRSDYLSQTEDVIRIHSVHVHDLESVMSISFISKKEGFVILYFPTSILEHRAVEEYDATYDSDEEADFTKMDMVSRPQF